MSTKNTLALLEKNLTRLKIEYEQYFMRRLKREPLKLRGEVEGVIRLYSGKNITNTGLKFKFNSLIARYNAYRQYWTRTLRAIEDGTYARRAETSLVSSSAGEKTPPVKGPAAAPPDAPVAPDPEEEDLSAVYRQYIAARKKCNKPVNGITLEKFIGSVKKSRDRIAKDYKIEDTDLKVIEKDGSVRLAITPKGKG